MHARTTHVHAPTRVLVDLQRLRLLPALPWSKQVAHLLHIHLDHRQRYLDRQVTVLFYHPLRLIEQAPHKPRRHARALLALHVPKQAVRLSTTRLSIRKQAHVEALVGLLQHRPPDSFEHLRLLTAEYMIEVVHTLCSLLVIHNNAAAFGAVHYNFGVAVISFS
ncbi:kinesin, putative [Leishmania tarentolae]|uniref:Kinesin, putative n=1 Tax=Leishmania tarentolae TaxID=5689 RepID=A0A640KLD2_LEITA|nr:kinesin, putative [Leishmania tarentolae]